MGSAVELRAAGRWLELPITWIIAALLSSVGFATVSLTDKAIMSGMGLRVRAFLLFIGLQSVTMWLVLSAIDPPDPSLPLEIHLRGLAVGLMWGTGAPVILWTLSREEVSRVAPIFQSYPLLVVIFAIVLLGESLGLSEAVAVTLAIGGALLAAAQFSSGGRVRLSSAIGYLLLAMVVIALAQILLKTVTRDISFLQATALRGAGLAMVLIPMNLRSDIWRELVAFMSGGRSALALAVDAGAAVMAMVLMTYAIAQGPVSLVNAAVSGTPLIIFFGSIVVSRRTGLLPGEVITRPVIAQKLVASLLVVSGLALLALSN